MTRDPARPLTPSELAAVQAYAAKRGRTWRAQLRVDWAHARLTGELHALRNTHGHAWLEAFKLPKAAPAPLPPTEGPWEIGPEYSARVDGYRVQAFPISAHGQAIGLVFNGSTGSLTKGHGNGPANAALIGSAGEARGLVADFAAAYCPPDDSPMTFEAMNEVYGRALEFLDLPARKVTAPPAGEPSEVQQRVERVTGLAEEFLDGWEEDAKEGGDKDDRRAQREAREDFEHVRALIEGGPELLREACGAISELLHQVEQMRGMFSDEDCSITEATEEGEQVSKKILAALALAGVKPNQAQNAPKESAQLASGPRAHITEGTEKSA